MLQQCLPFTVLKLIFLCTNGMILSVATVLTVYGIETTTSKPIPGPDRTLVATVLTVYGIETSKAVSAVKHK